MRKLRIALITIAGGVPAIAATIFACGSDAESVDAPPDARADVDAAPSFEIGDTGHEAPPIPPQECRTGADPYVVELPDAGVLATPAQLCAVSQPAAATNAARVTFTTYSAGQTSVSGFVAVPPDLEAVIVGSPSLAVTLSRSGPQSITIGNITKVAGGFQFTGDLETPASCRDSMDVAATFEITCTDGGTKTVESRTRLDLCDAADGGLGWVSSGDQCCDCKIIAEMAPSPIVSDKKKDDLPLARVVRLRVLELARAGRQVLLFAESDAGNELEISWSVSDGSLERVAPDVVIWTLPADDDASSFGQVAVWNDAGAAVENFAWGVA